MAANLLHMEEMAFPGKMHFSTCLSCIDDDEPQHIPSETTPPLPLLCCSRAEKNLMGNRGILFYIQFLVIFNLLSSPVLTLWKLNQNTLVVQT